MIDITHGIAPHDVLQGALVLADTLPYMPAGVHLAVVDPGCRQRSQAARAPRAATDGSTSGPTTDSCSSRPTGSEESRRPSSSRIPAYRLEPVPERSTGATSSRPRPRTSPPGVELGELGPEVPLDELVRLELPYAEVGTRRIRATVLYVDRFGNVQLDLDAREPRAGRDRPWHARRGRGRVRALLRRRGPDLRRGPARRHRPLRGRLREHLARHQPGRRRPDVRRRGRRGRSPDRRWTRERARRRGVGRRFARLRDAGRRRVAGPLAPLPPPLRAQFDAARRQWQGSGRRRERWPRSPPPSTGSTRPPARILDLGTGTGNGRPLVGASAFPRRDGDRRRPLARR